MECVLWRIAFLFVLHYHEYVKAFAPSDDYYTAGVVEFRPTVEGKSSAEMVEEHLKAYVEIIHSLEANETDIIVFPEGTLNNQLQLTYVPGVQEKIIPCQNASIYEDFLVQLSCAASNVRKYLVINLTEKENCPTAEVLDPRPCASNGLNVYNTNVVFDRDGRVISKYRKVHVYVEEKNTTVLPEFAIFETDFGVRFGHFICFDILFYTPAEDLIRRYDVTEIIFTSWFYSELPFLTAVQLQQSWAMGNNVNLLAAGASRPENGITGSGIYAGNDGTLTSIMATGSGLRKIFVAKVPKSRNNKSSSTVEMHSLKRSHGPKLGYVKFMKDPQIENFNSELLNITAAQQISRVLCADKLCCRFSLLIESLETIPFYNHQHYKYRIGVFNGRRTYEKQEWSSLKICAIYACTNDTAKSCGEILTTNSSTEHSNSLFKSIHIEGDFDKADKLLIMPNTLNDRFYPLEAHLIKWNIIDQSNRYQVQINASDILCDSLLTFGIYANYYDSAAKATYSVSTMLQLLIWIGIIIGSIVN